MSESSALNGVFIPLPLRLRKHHRRGSGESVRAKDREKGYTMLSTGHDTAIANMISQQLCLPTGPAQYGSIQEPGRGGMGRVCGKKHPSYWLLMDPRWGTIIIFSCRTQWWTCQTPMDSSKLITSEIIMDSGVTRQNRKTWVWERGIEETRVWDDKGGWEIREGRQELIQWTVYML